MTVINKEVKDATREFVRARTLEAIHHDSGVTLSESSSDLYGTALELTRFLGYEPCPGDGRFDLKVWVGRAVLEKFLRDLPEATRSGRGPAVVKGLPYLFEPGSREEELRDLAELVIGMPSARDAQRMPGPSDLGDQCDVCLARKIAEFLGMEEPARRYIYAKTWVGTAVHERLERSMPQVYADARLEITVPIADIRGLGLLSGHVDVHMPEIAAINDYKTADLGGHFGLRKMRTAGIKRAYQVQLMLYCHGLVLAGLPVSWANLTFIPRDAPSFEEIWTVTAFYHERTALFALERAETLTDVVLSDGRHALQPDLEGPCFNCVIRPRLK